MKNIEHQVRLFPRDASLRLRLAGLYETAERPDEAVRAYEAALSLEPANRSVLAGLARLKVAKAVAIRGDSRAFLALIDQADSLAAASGLGALRLDSDLLEARGDAVLSLRADREQAGRWYAAAGTPSARLKLAMAARIENPASASAIAESLLRADVAPVLRDRSLELLARLAPERAGRAAAKLNITDPTFTSDTIALVYWRGRAAVDSGSREEYAARLARAGRRREAVEIRKRIFSDAPEPAGAESLFRELLALKDPDAPAFALRSGVALPSDSIQLRKWAAGADARVFDPRVRAAALAALGDERTFSECVQLARLRLVSGETTAAKGLLEKAVASQSMDRRTAGGAETRVSVAADLLFDLVKKNDAAAAYELLPRLSPGRLGGLSESDLSAAHAEAVRRGEKGRALDWARRLALLRPSDSAAHLAWWRAARDAGKGESEAARAAWRLVRDNRPLLDDLLARSVTPSAGAALIDEYRGPLDGKLRALAVEFALADRRLEKAHSLLLASGEASPTLEDRSPAFSLLADSLARAFLAARRIDPVLELAKRFDLAVATRGAVSEILVSLGRLDEAVQFGARDPMILARVSLKTGDTAAALGHLRKARELGTIDPSLLERLHDLSRDTGERFLVALSLSTRGVKSRPVKRAGIHSAVARVLLEDDAVNLARSYAAWGLPERAVRLLEGKEALIRTTPDLAVFFTRAALAAGDARRARVYLAQALAGEPLAKDLLSAAYAVAKEEKNRGEQIDLLERLARAEGDAAHGVVGELPGLYIAEALHSGSDRKAALKYLRRARALDPTSATVLYNIGLIHSVSNETDSALEAITECLRVSPGDVDALLLAAMLYKKKGRNAEAADAYRKAIESGAPLKARQELAVLLSALGDTPGAAVAAGEAYRLSPTDPAIARTFGVLAAGSHRWAEALPALERSVRAYSSDAEARKCYAIALIECGQESAARRVVQSHPDPLVRLFIAVKADMAAGRASASLDALRPMRARADFRPLYLAALADAADRELAKGAVEKAKVYWREWLAADPGARIPKALLAATMGPSGSVPLPATAPQSVPSAQAPAVTVSPRGVSAPNLATPSSASPVLPPRRPPTSAPSPAAPRASDLKTAAEAIRQRRFPDAEQAVRTYIATHPRSTTAWNLLAIALNGQGRREAAAEAFASSLRIDPDQPEVRSAMSELGGNR